MSRLDASDPGTVVRIAIALAVLRHKPKDQSFASYLLDLQSRFPLATKVNDSRDWRTYALELEKQLSALQAQRDADQELLSKHPADASTMDAPPPKKKSKKNPTKDQHDLECSWDQSRADWSRSLASQYPSSPSLVAAYTSLKGALAAPNADPFSYASRLTHAILRALDAIHHFLFSPPSPAGALDTPLQPGPEHIDSTRITLASPLLSYLLRTALHAVIHTAQDVTKPKRPRQRIHVRAATLAPSATDMHALVDKILDHLLERVLLPLLRAITPLCSARLALLLVPMPVKKDRDKTGRLAGRGKGKEKEKDKDKDTLTDGFAWLSPPKETDLRTDVVALVGTSLQVLDALPHLDRPLGPHANIVGGIRDRLGLEAIRELEALYAVPVLPSVPVQPSSQRTPAASSDFPLSSLTPNPTPAASSSQVQIQAESQCPPQTERCSVAESRAKRLEKLTGTRAERVRALATRDAGWFLASTLNLCVSPMPTQVGHHDHGAAPHDHGPASATSARTEQAVPGRLLREALLDRVGKLVRSLPYGELCDSLDGGDGDTSRDRAAATTATDSKFAIDPVCQNMLLAICERAMCHLASS